MKRYVENFDNGEGEISVFWQFFTTKHIDVS